MSLLLHRKERIKNCISELFLTADEHFYTRNEIIYYKELLKMVEVKKLQNFLKNLHKFDKKLDLTQELEAINQSFEKLVKAIKSEDKEKISMTLREHIIELINYVNTKDVDLDEALEKGFNL